MNKKTVYEFHPQTKEFVRTNVAFESPLEPEHFLMPTSCTDVEPPTPQEGKAIVFNEITESWDLVDDKRGIWYAPDRTEHYVALINDVIPSNWTREIPPKTINELKIEKNAQINAWRAAANTSTFTHGGKTFSCDALSRSDIDAVNGRIATRNTFPANWVGGWKAVDNTILAITTVTEWNDFYDSMVNQGTANFAHAQTLKASLLAATTEQQVAAIVW